MTVYSTCRRCRTLLHVVDGNTVHPTCEPRYTQTEKLELRLRTAVKDGNDRLAARMADEIAELEHQPPDTGAAAQRYASEFGWPVFPCIPDEKRPTTAHGFKNASVDPDKIRRWWRDNPGRNIGTPTGIGFDVIDIDVAKGDNPPGELAWPDMATRMAEQGIDIHGEARTPSGGRHLYVLPTGDPNMADMWPGIDYRGTGGYVLVPPSTIGRYRYEWVVAPSPAIKKG